MVGGVAVEVPAVEHVFAAVVEERVCSGLVDVDVGFGAEAIAIRVQLEEAVGEEESRFTIIGLRGVRCSATLASRLGAILCLVAGAATVEAKVVAVGLVVTAGTSCLCSLPAAVAVTISSLGSFLFCFFPPRGPRRASPLEEAEPPAPPASFF